MEVESKFIPDNPNKLGDLNGGFKFDVYSNPLVQTQPRRTELKYRSMQFNTELKI